MPLLFVFGSVYFWWTQPTTPALKKTHHESVRVESVLCSHLYILFDFQMNKTTRDYNDHRDISRTFWCPCYLTLYCLRLVRVIYYLVYVRIILENVFWWPCDLSPVLIICMNKDCLNASSHRMCHRMWQQLTCYLHVAGHRGLSITAALTVVEEALWGCDHYCQIMALFQTDNDTGETDWFILPCQLKPLTGTELDHSDDSLGESWRLLRRALRAVLQKEET